MAQNAVQPVGWILWDTGGSSGRIRNRSPSVSFDAVPADGLRKASATDASSDEVFANSVMFVAL